jgi:transposase
LGILRWLETVHIPDTATEGVAYQHLLRAIDGLISVKEEIEKDLYNQVINLFSPDVDLVFYDITSSYFEGDGPEMAAYGYSRDHRPDLKQIVIALAVTREGFPLFHEVLPGNTADVSTLADAVQTLSKRFKIRKTVVVCDRGMVSRNNAEAELLYQKTLAGFIAEPSLKGLFIKETAKGGIRYIQCHNPEVAREKKAKRQERVAKIHKEIRRLEKRRQRGELSEQDLHHKALQAIEQRHMTPFFEPRIESGKVILYQDTEVWDREEYLDGKFILKTNLPSSQCPTAEVVRSYKQLQQVERAFRKIKDFLKIRPVYHYTDDRVRAHVFLCVLAYLLEKVVEQHCQSLPQVTSARRALSLLSRLKAIECRAGGKTVTVTNRVDKEITNILTALGVQPIKKILYYSYS